MTTCKWHEDANKIPSTEPRPEATVVTSECTHCPAEITCTLQWWRCMNDGCEGKWWVQDTVESLDRNERMCEKCLDRKMEGLRRAQKYMSDTPPADFDPMYCGERWSDDY